MSTPEDVAARLTECLDDEWAPLEGGMLRTLVPSWLVRATAAELASQRERLERERDEAKAISQGWELQAGEAEAEAREVVERVKATREKLVDYACHFGARDEVSKLFIAAALDHAEAVSVMLAAITAAPEVRG